MQQIQPCVEAMTIQITEITPLIEMRRFPHFSSFRTAWRKATTKKVHIEPHWFVLYAILRDVPPVASKFGFSEISNKKKINNGQDSWNGLIKALSEIIKVVKVLQEDADSDESTSILLSFSKDNPFNATQKELKEYFLHFSNQFFGSKSILNTIELR